MKSNKFNDFEFKKTFLLKSNVITGFVYLLFGFILTCLGIVYSQKNNNIDLKNVTILFGIATLITFITQVAFGIYLLVIILVVIKKNDYNFDDILKLSLLNLLFIWLFIGFLNIIWILKLNLKLTKVNNSFTKSMLDDKIKLRIENDENYNLDINNIDILEAVNFNIPLDINDLDKKTVSTNK